jgi:hypothetical protein
MGILPALSQLTDHEHYTVTLADLRTRLVAIGEQWADNQIEAELAHGVSTGVVRARLDARGDCGRYATTRRMH